jgi:hypothetical protein
MAELVSDGEALSEQMAPARQDHAPAPCRIGDQSAFESALGLESLYVLKLPGQIFDRDRDSKSGRGLQDERNEAVGGSRAFSIQVDPAQVI